MRTRRKKPARGSASRKDEYLQIRVEATEKAGFEAAASLSGLALSAWVRERLRRIAREELEHAKLVVPFLPTPTPLPAGSAGE